MKGLVFTILVSLCVILLHSETNAQRRGSSSRSTWSTPRNTYTPKFGSSFTPKKQTYDMGGTKYILGENYKTTGAPKVDRSPSAKKEFLESRGYQKNPAGYDVDHIVPLSKGGADQPYNMQLLPKQVHKQKTASERKKH